GQGQPRLGVCDPFEHGATSSSWMKKGGDCPPKPYDRSSANRRPGRASTAGICTAAQPLLDGIDKLQGAEGQRRQQERDLETPPGDCQPDRAGGPECRGGRGPGDFAPLVTLEDGAATDEAHA